jgi:hypothetical protein
VSLHLAVPVVLVGVVKGVLVREYRYLSLRLGHFLLRVASVTSRVIQLAK